MVFPRNPHDRVPRGDKNRRLSLGLSRDEFAAAARVSVEQLHDYEHTQPDRHERYRFRRAERTGGRFPAPASKRSTAGFRWIST